ncbi:MAG TPA: hypothetical protein VFC82_02120 [Actinomycetaceae bacterium]|nr:hypothetical protein [Actinomycetaceae bacterium]
MNSSRDQPPDPAPAPLITVILILIVNVLLGTAALTLLPLQSGLPGSAQSASQWLSFASPVQAVGLILGVIWASSAGRHGPAHILIPVVIVAIALITGGGRGLERFLPGGDAGFAGPADDPAVVYGATGLQFVILMLFAVAASAMPVARRLGLRAGLAEMERLAATRRLSHEVKAPPSWETNGTTTQVNPYANSEAFQEASGSATAAMYADAGELARTPPPTRVPAHLLSGLLGVILSLLGLWWFGTRAEPVTGPSFAVTPESVVLLAILAACVATGILSAWGPVLGGLAPWVVVTLAPWVVVTLVPVLPGSPVEFASVTADLVKGYLGLIPPILIMCGIAIGNARDAGTAAALPPAW